MPPKGAFFAWWLGNGEDCLLGPGHATGCRRELSCRFHLTTNHTFGFQPVLNIMTVATSAQFIKLESQFRCSASLEGSVLETAPTAAFRRGATSRDYHGPTVCSWLCSTILGSVTLLLFMEASLPLFIADGLKWLDRRGGSRLLEEGLTIWFRLRFRI